MQRNRKRYALLVAVIFLAAALLPATALGSTPPQSSTGPSIAGGVSDLSVTVTPPTEPGTPATIHISVTGEPSTGLSMGWAVGALRPADGYTVIPVRDGSGSFTTGNLDESTWVWITVVDASGIPYPNAISRKAYITIQGTPNYQDVHIVGVPAQGAVQGEPIQLSIASGSTDPFPANATYEWTVTPTDSGTFSDAAAQYTTFTPTVATNSSSIQCSVLVGGIGIAQARGDLIVASPGAPEITLTATPSDVLPGENFELSVSSESDLTGAAFLWQVPVWFTPPKDLSASTVQYTAPDREDSYQFSVSAQLPDGTHTREASATVYVYRRPAPEAEMTVSGPASVAPGETISVIVGTEPSTTISASGSIRTQGLEFTSVSSSVSSADHVYVLDLSGFRIVEYKYKVTATLGETVSFEVANVEVTDGSRDGPAPNAKWSATVDTEPGSSGSPTPMPTPPSPSQSLRPGTAASETPTPSPGQSLRPGTTASEPPTPPASYWPSQSTAPGTTSSGQPAPSSSDQGVESGTAISMPPASPIPVPAVPVPMYSPTPPVVTPPPTSASPSPSPSSSASASSTPSEPASEESAESGESSASPSPSPTESAVSSASPDATPGPSAPAPEPEPVAIKPDAPDMPASVEVIPNPHGQGSLLIGADIGSLWTETLADQLTSWIQNPAPGTVVEMLSADGELVSPEEQIATGMVVEVRTEDGELLQSTTIVVKGDVTGSGEMDLTQLVRLAAAYNGTDPLEGPYRDAGDLNGDDDISLTDLVDLAGMFMGSSLHVDYAVTNGLDPELFQETGYDLQPWTDAVALTNAGIPENAKVESIAWTQHDIFPDGREQTLYYEGPEESLIFGTYDAGRTIITTEVTTMSGKVGRAETSIDWSAGTQQSESSAEVLDTGDVRMNRAVSGDESASQEERAQASASRKPTASVRPRPTASSRPSATARPTATASSKPSATARPSATKRPVGTAKPSVAASATATATLSHDFHLPSAADLTTYRSQCLSATNGLRDLYRIRPLLRRSDDLAKAAMVRAEEMAASNTLNHTRPDGTKYNTVVTLGQGIVVGENIHKNRGYLTADIAKVATNGWENSAPHRKQMLEPRYLYTGLGFAQAGDGSWYCVQLFSNGDEVLSVDTPKPPQE